ncbi:DUF1775 domain-containing protein [Streptomyces sp. NPDC085946]|uniref:DUF1775 domain-containing protein n=1 Tax=Streptomyces sp. NPDC085946 TaxID=3365744 RepID=UPI0037CE5184
MFPALKRSATVRRLTLLTAAGATAVLVTAGPAFAHVEVEAEEARALAENVELTFTAESESATAGITGLRVVLPEGITPADVTFGAGPEGWTFTANDDGYIVKGPAVRAGEDAEHSVVVRQLPDAEELAFKTLQTYSDGRIDRWIELGGSGGDGHGHGHGHEAPVLELRAAEPGAKPVEPSPSDAASASASPTPAPRASEPTASPAAKEADEEDGGLSAGAWTGIGAAVLLVAAGAAYVVRRRAGAGR